MNFEKLLVLSTSALVSLCLGVGLSMMAFSAVPQPAEMVAAIAPGVFDRAPDKGAARAEIETMIAQTPEYARYFARLRETFTADYEATLDDFAAQRAQSKADPGVDYYLSETVRRLRQARGALAAKAEPAPIAAVFARQLEVLQAAAQDDKRMCVAFLYGATNADFQNFAEPRRALMAEMALASLDAILNGQTKKIDREAPTEEDFRLLETALSERGLGKQEIDALLDGKMPDPPLEDARMCGAGQTYFEVLKTLPEPARTKVYGLALELMARS